MSEAPPRLTPRDLRRPGWLAAHAGIVLLAIAFALLGRWQWDVGHKVAPLTTAQLAAWRTPEPVGSVITASSGLNGTEVGQAVSVTGTYDSARQLLVPGRSLGGRNGYYVLAPLVTGTHQALVVNRGFLPSAGGGEPAVPAAPAGRISVTGWAAEPESTTGEVNANGITQQQQTGAATAANEIQFISPAALVNLWPYQLPDAYVTATDSASLAGGLIPIPAPLPQHGTTWDLLNVCYAFQWWLFIVILGSWYVVYLRRELRPRPLGADEDEDYAGDLDDDADAEETADRAAPATAGSAE
ncbi:SURF1 family protein [Actinospica robiniae]|uniref:SURF1 family protein n=1 Tax=Actinospica robiniae TaxID=304901 RepID=UPI0005509081|nr:SURF1 family protein [Actinospica robiniae]